MESAEIEKMIDKFHWVYPYDLNGIKVPVTSVHEDRAFERRRYFIEPIIANGFLRGKRVLDLACFSGWFSLEALRGGAAYVHGVDAAPRFIDQANFVFDALDVDESTFSFECADIFEFLRREDVWTYDIVLLLGIMYHIDRPMELMEAVRQVTGELLIIDTMVFNYPDAAIQLRAEGGNKPLLESAKTDIAFVPSPEAVHWFAKINGFNCASLTLDFQRDGVRDYIHNERMAFACTVDREPSELYENVSEEHYTVPATFRDWLSERHGGFSRPVR